MVSLYGSDTPFHSSCSPSTMDSLRAGRREGEGEGAAGEGGTRKTRTDTDQRWTHSLACVTLTH